MHKHHGCIRGRTSTGGGSLQDLHARWLVGQHQALASTLWPLQDEGLRGTLTLPHHAHAMTRRCALLSLVFTPSLECASLGQPYCPAKDGPVSSRALRLLIRCDDTRRQPSYLAVHNVMIVRGLVQPEDTIGQLNVPG
jgi:hypothetical protein